MLQTDTAAATSPPTRKAREAKSPIRAAFEQLIHGAARFELKSEGVLLYIAEVTPAKAQAVLEHCNIDNRKVRQKKIGEYADYFRRGDWMLRGTLEFLAPSGRLHDGQHRLLALVDAAATEKFLVQVIPDSKASKASQFTDIGVSRTLPDYLRFHGVFEAYRTAPLLKYEKNARVSAGNPLQSATYERLEYLNLYHEIGEPKIRAAFDVVPSALWRKMAVEKAIVDWFALQVTQIDTEGAQLFLHYVAEPEGLRSSDPMFVLHQRLAEIAASGKRRAISAAEHIVMLIKAWNLHHDQQPATAIKLRYRSHEQFPEIKGFAQ